MLKYFHTFILPFFGGALYALGFPSFIHQQKVFFFGPIIGAGLLLAQFPFLRKENSFKQAFLSLLCFCLSFNLLGYYWLHDTIQVFGQIPFPLNYLLGLLFTIFIAPQYWVFLFILLLIKTYWKKNLVLNLSSTHITWAFLLTLCEYFVPQQFPGHLGHPWISFAPYLHLTPYFGVPIFSFLSFWIILTLLSFIREKLQDRVAIFIIATLLIINFHKPLSRLSTGNTLNLQVRVVQANIGNYLKISSEKGHSNSLDRVLNLYSDLSTRSSAKPLDLIIWPETAYPHPQNSSSLFSGQKEGPMLFNRIIRLTQAEVLFGGYDENKSDVKNSLGDYETLYNAAFFLGEQGKLLNVYHKHLLIPFGETLPFGPFNQILSQYVDNISYFSKGTTYPLFETRKGITFVTAICYELLFSHYIRKILNQVSQTPHLLINLTNDSWYGDTAEPSQHLFLAKWRSLEFGLPIIRSTNTGISSVIYPDGSESKRLKVGEEGTLDIELFVPANPSATFFQRWGIFGLFFLWAGLLAFFTMVPRVSNYFFKKNPSFKRS